MVSEYSSTRAGKAYTFNGRQQKIVDGIYVRHNEHGMGEHSHRQWSAGYRPEMLQPSAKLHARHGTLQPQPDPHGWTEQPAAAVVALHSLVTGAARQSYLRERTTQL